MSDYSKRTHYVSGEVYATKGIFLHAPHKTEVLILDVLNTKSVGDLGCLIKYGKDKII